MRIVTVAICIAIIGSSTANLFFPLIASDETLSVMTIVDQDASDEVFVAGENIIYKLSANLSQLMSVTVSNDSSVRVRVRGLSVSNGGQYIMACLTTGSCIGYDVINLNRTNSSVPLNEPGETIFTGDDPVVMFPGAAEGIVYTGTATDFEQDYRMSLGRYRVSSGLMADTTRDYVLDTSLQSFSTRIFKTGFNVDNFTYYVVEDDGADIRILRVCNESANSRFRALYEVHLICGLSTLFAGATLYRNFPNSTDNTLILIVQPPAGQPGTGRLCTYKISDINMAMDAGRTACANGVPRPVVWDRFPGSLFNVICSSLPMCVLDGFNIDVEGIRGEDLQAELIENFATIGNVFTFTSSVLVQVEEELLIFIGTRNGVLLKYIFINQNFSDSELYNTTSITDTSITSLQWSLGSEYVYGLTSRQVIAIPVEDCESFRECTSCTGLEDPLCGWCSIEKKCSRRSECSNNNETRRWIQDQTMCIGTFAISPNTHPVELINEQFNITADQLPPPLDDESYYCVFGNLGSSLLEGDLIPGVDFTDLTCNYSFIVEQFSNGRNDTAVVNFSLGSDLTNINFVTIDDGFTFFNCSTHTSCRSCLSSNNLCGWCLYDKKCTSSSDQCRVSTDWINTDDNSSTECPLILLRSNVTDGVSDYQQPVGVLRNLSLNALNLPAPNNEYRYWCVISYNGETSRIQAEYTGPNNGLLCVPKVDDFMSVSYVNNSSVSVLWMGPNVTYYLDTEIVPVTVILYNCSALAGVCSSCLSVSNLLSLDCGWCHDSSSCVVTESCSASSTFTANNSDTCPLPQITMVNPNSGPYQGGTAVTINGTDLGVVFEDIINATIGGVLCIIESDSYQPGVGFICKTSEFTDSPSVSMSVHDVKISINRNGSEKTASLMSAFKYAMVSIANFTPERIPESGNITIAIFGNNFDISNPMLAEIELAEISCDITNQEAPNSTFVQCIAGSREFRASGPVVFTIDNSVTESEGDFIYTDDPQVFSLRDNEVIMSGGNNIIFTGRNLDVVPTALTIDVVEISTNTTLETDSVDCTAQSDRELSCTFPAILTDYVEEIINGTLELRYSLVAASVPGLDNLHLMSQFVIEFVDDPVVNCFTEPLNYQAGSNAPITITGMNLLAVDENEILVTVDDEQCNITTHFDNQISCIPPQSSSGNADFVVKFGMNLSYTCAEGTDGTGIQIQYQEPVGDDEENNLPIYIPIAVGAVILIIIVLFILILCIVIQRYRKKEKQSEKLFADLQMQLEEMESGLADECKTAFTELQTDLELVYHSEGTLPFLDFRSFAMRFLFPRDQNHVVLRPLEIPPGANKDDVVRQLETFKKLLMNKKFIHTMVKTLEGNPQKFGIPDRCNVASYLMVAFQTDLDYATEILMLLLGDLIQRSLSTRQNPKLLLRRTESVAEKMLANWLCFLLYPYILDSCGESLYVLVKAIKARLEKGPIDVVTGEAKYSLSDERLLRHAIDPKPVEGYALSPTGEEIPVKMWECDTITQAKEKILDAIYKNNPVSSRPSITEIDLELATSVEHGVPLRDFDASNETDGEFKKINTLGHFHLHVLSAEAASNPKKPPPKFRLVTRRDDRSPVNVKADMVGTIILNPSALSSAHLSIAEDEKIYHLVKPEDNNVDQVGAGGGRQKLIREVFLPRLLATKRILQPFVDDLFKVVFTVPRGKPLPKAIKYLFDFLDWQAAHNGISDPEVLHTWKTNSLPLRFWVNVIKNPEFVFDINKSATVDSCLSTVASAYIDACSTKEYPYSKDAPASKLLYISEVKSYKANIQQYYQNIQSLPKIGDHEMATYLREVYQNQQSYFVAESAMYELFKYCKQYSEQLIENLEGDGLKSVATNFEKLLEEFQ